MQKTTTDGSVAAGIVIGSGAACNHRTIPCEPASVLSVPVAGATPRIIQEDEGTVTTKKPVRKHTTCNPFVYEALRLLAEHGYDADRLTTNNKPVAVIATKGQEVLKIAVIRSRKPVPDAKTLHNEFPVKFREICAFAKPREFRTMIWVTSPLIGWRYYLVETGGIRRDWDFTTIMEG
jgi:hypothetical protein